MRYYVKGLAFCLTYAGWLMSRSLSLAFKNGNCRRIDNNDNGCRKVETMAKEGYEPLRASRTAEVRIGRLG